MKKVIVLVTNLIALALIMVLAPIAFVVLVTVDVITRPRILWENSIWVDVAKKINQVTK